MERLQNARISDRRWNAIIRRLETKSLKTNYFFLPPDDDGDRLIARPFSEKSIFGRSYEDFLNSFTSAEGPAPMTPMSVAKLPQVAIQAYKVQVLDPEDDLMKDDLFLYFFVTDGVIPTGHITGIYRGNGANDTFVLDNLERVVYPMGGDISKGRSPHGHLIIDYGIIESDGDDIKDLKRISEAIVEITFEIYYLTGQMKLPQMLRLRKEVRNLSDALLSLNHDDRLVNESLYFREGDFAKIFTGDNTIHEFTKELKGKRYFSSWDYRISFRVLKFR
jgi:hypothetical protein